MALQDVLDKINQYAQNERDKGTAFEKLIVKFLQTDPQYQALYKKVWMWAEWVREYPQYNANAQDLGIDLVALDRNDEFTAIQCKFYAQDHKLVKEDIDSFFTYSGRRPFTHRLIVVTTNNISDSVSNSLSDQTIPVNLITLEDLENSDIDWLNFDIDRIDQMLLKPKKLDKPQIITNNIKALDKDIEVLKKHFPHCFDKDGNFQLEKFKQSFTEKNISFSTESYSLEWLGKSYARLLASDPATTLLKADETHNAKPENANSENLLIKGDNLEVLKHLVNAYYEKVKMIYIDPPYNTGSDGFMYNDDRKFTVKELQNLIGVDAEKAKRILDFTQSKSNSHSAWLTFMYPRLYIAKQLLKDEGVIFVSIDDNEFAQLRLLMDEIFGEENFVATYKWNKTSTPPSLSKKVRQKYEFVLCYEKSTSGKIFNGGITDGGDMPLLNDGNNIGVLEFKPHIVNFKIEGAYKKGIYDRVELLDDILVKNGRADISFRLKGPFKWKQDNLDEEVENGTVFHIKSDKFAIRYEKQGERTKVPADIISKTECSVGTNEDANKELFELFKTEGLFDYPKTTTLVKYLSNFRTESNDIILDFFAGSGTTGDAVMQLNAEDGGNRKFILVQLPEPIDPKKSKVAYDFVKNELKTEPTIFEITKERLLRAIKNINTELDKKIEKLKSELLAEENNAEIEKLESCKSQNSFKIFETVPIWEDYDFEAEQFDISQKLFDVDKLTPDDVKALLITWKTYDGIALTQDLKSVDLGGYISYYGNGRLYLMHKGFSTDHLKVLLEKIDTDKEFEPNSIIAFGYHMESKNLREISENIKTYNNKKKTEIDFIIRY